MGWFKRRKDAQQASLVETLASAFAGALGRVLEAQTAQITQSGAFLNTLQDLSARKAAQIMGSRGGRTTQARKKEARRQDAASPPKCPLCRDPNARHFTVEQYNAHAAHAQPEEPEQPEQGN